MNAFAAAAADEDGDTINALRARVADLEAQLDAIGAGGIGPLMGWSPPPSAEAVIQMTHDAAVLGNIDSPFNACMHQEHCKHWKSEANQPDIGIPTSVPTGWKLVPVEPTRDMLVKWIKADVVSNWIAPSLYQEMLAVAPKPPVIKESGWPKLEKPARVGGGSFGVGTSSRHVVEAAQREHDEHVRAGALTHDQIVEEERNRRALWDLIHGSAAPQPPVVRALLAPFSTTYSGVLRALVREHGGIPVSLYHEPDNRADPDAVAVVSTLPELVVGGRSVRSVSGPIGQRIGYVARTDAVKQALANRLDSQDAPIAAHLVIEGPDMWIELAAENDDDGIPY